MDWQETVALLITACAASLFLRSLLRRRRFSFQRDTHCGCSGGGRSPLQSRIIFHARKGQRPEILVKAG